MAFHMLAIVDSGTCIVVDCVLGDVAKRRMKSNKSFFDGREIIKLRRIPMLTTDGHVIDRAGSRQHSAAET